jgi:hypothetical protein
MSAIREPRPYTNPYVAGTLLGVVLFLSLYVTGGGLGASAAMSRVQTGVLDLVAPAHVDRVAYFAEMAGGRGAPGPTTPSTCSSAPCSGASSRGSGTGA